MQVLIGYKVQVAGADSGLRCFPRLLRSLPEGAHGPLPRERAPGTPRRSQMASQMILAPSLPSKHVWHVSQLETWGRTGELSLAIIGQECCETRCMFFLDPFSPKYAFP